MDIKHSRRILLKWGIAALTAQILEPLRAVAAEAKRIRITGVEAFRVRVPAGTVFSVSRVHTDAGVTGTSFVPCADDVLNKFVKPVIVGEDLFAIDRHMARLQAFRGESGVQAWSGIEHAMWDAAGRISGRPVAQLLGGTRDRLRVYRTTVWPRQKQLPANSPPLESDQSDVAYETQAAFALKLKQNGFSGIKVRAWRPHPMDDVDMVGVMRAAVGPDFKIMLDRTAVRPGWVWDYPTALKVCRGLEKHGAYWLEEPFDGHDVQAPARLAAEVDILITGGELAKSTYEFLDFLQHKTYDILQPDTRICGGILAAHRISILAEAFGVPCIQHGTTGPALAGYIQAGCAMSNCEWQEVIGTPILPQEEWATAKPLLRTPELFRIQDGHVLLPDFPGLGLDLNEDAIKEYRIRA